MPEGIRLLETLVLKGPNFWSYRPCVWMRIDLGPFRDRPSNELRSFGDQLRRLLPGLQEHHCSEGAAGGFLKRVAEGTWLGHVAEHVAIEIQQEVGIPVSFGRTRETKTSGVYNLVYEMEEERVGVRAGKLALDVVEHCAGLDVDLDLDASIDRLKRKYGSSVDEILAFHDDVTRRLNEVETSGERLEELKRQQARAAAGYEKAAAELTAQRTAAAAKLFDESDENKRGSLDQAGIAAAINRLLPPPRPGFVPPGFGPPDAGRKSSAAPPGFPEPPRGFGIGGRPTTG